jgi:hypothetical protein
MFCDRGKFLIAEKRLLPIVGIPFRQLHRLLKFSRRANNPFREFLPRRN